MVRLHVVDDYVIRGLSAELRFHARQPLFRKAPIHCIQYGSARVAYDVRIIRNTIRDRVLALEKVYIPVLDSCV